VKGRAGLAEFEDGAVKDPEVLAVTRKVAYALDPTIDYPRQFVGDVEITLADGQVLRERQDRPRGGPDAPLSREELEAKFRGNAAVLSSDRIERTIRLVDALDTRATLPDLFTALTPERT
jgi:2-methylcitrate dehydratase PrpD